MHENVGVATNGRGEVAVRTRAQRVVAKVLGQVHRPALRAQQQRVRWVGGRRSLRAPEDRLDGKRVAGEKPNGRLAVNHAQLAQGLEHGAQVLLDGLLVNAIGGGRLGVGQAVRHALVREQHGLLDEPRRARSSPHGNARRAPVAVERDLGLHGLELDGATLLSHPLAQGTDLVQRAQELSDPLAPGNGRTLVEKGVDLVVAEARRGADRGGEHLGAQRATARVESHDHAHGEPVLARTQRADVVGEALGQHGNHAINQVRRAGPSLRLVVDGRVGAHVVRDVSDVHAELVTAVGKAARAHGVVEVTRVSGIDGHAELAAQVAAVRIRGECPLDVRHDLLGLLLHRAGEVAGQPVARHDGLDVEVKLPRRAHAPLDGHHRRARTRRVLRDARDHDVALANAEARRARVLRHHEEVVADARVERRNGTERPCLGVGSQERLDGASHHRANHGTRRHAATLDEGDLNLIPVHGLALAAGQELEVPLRRLHVRGAGP